MEIGNWYVNPELLPEEIDRRRRAAQEWATSIQEVVDRTHDLEAQNLLNGVLSGIAVGIPDPERHLIPVQGPEQPTIIIVPLFYDDKNFNDTTRLMLNLNSSQAAHFTENKPGRIFFNAENVISPLLKGLLMLHEAKHAEMFESNQFREGGELDHWLEEADTFEFEFRLLQKLCGQPYQYHIKQATSRFIQEYDDKDWQVEKFPTPETLDVGVVDKIFGPSMSEREHQLRKSIVWMNVAFRMFEKIYPDTVTVEKAKFLRQVYGQ